MPKSFQDMIAEALGVEVGELDGRDGEVRNRIEDATRRLMPQIRSQLQRGEDVDGLAGFLASGGLDASPGNQQTASRFDLNNALTATLAKAFGLEGIENMRFDEAKKFLTSEFDKMNSSFNATNARQNRLMFSGAADQFGAQALSGMNNLRTSLGARGINPNSGAAAALAGNVALRQQGQLAGAKRDITIDSLRRRDAQSQQRFASAFGLGQFMNQGASEIGLAALGSLTSARFQQVQNNENLGAARKAQKDAQLGQFLGGVGQFAGAFA